jgi:hypothetical protein
LHEWIYNSIANIEINQRDLAIRGDANIQQSNWLWMFCKTKINNFNLVTGLSYRKITKKYTKMAELNTDERQKGGKVK